MKIYKYFVFFLVLVINIFPVFVFSAGLVPCENGCGFYDIIRLINNVINFVFVYLVVPICAVLLAYAGFKLIVSGGSSGEVEKAKGIFFDVLIGLFVAGASWVLVKLFLNIVGYKGDTFLE